VNGKTGFDSHQERENSISCTAPRLALKPTRGSNPGSKSGKERTDHPPPPVPWLKMCAAPFPLQHTPSCLVIGAQGHVHVYLNIYCTRLDLSTVMTADHNITRHLSKTHHVCKFPAMNTEACCPKKADHHCLSFAGQLISFHHPNYQPNSF